MKKDAQREKPRRLTLNRETIRQLDERMLQGLVGASEEETHLCIGSTSYWPWSQPTISG